MADTDLTRIPASRVPITELSNGMITREWYRFLFNLFNLAGSGEANSAASSSMGQDLAPAYTPQVVNNRYGAFVSTVTQTAAVINTAYAMTFNSTQLSSGVTVGSPTSRIYVDRLGVFDIQFSAQLNKVAGGSRNVYIWLRIDGTDVANSATVVTLAGTSSAVVAAWNFVVELNAGSYFELMWSTNDTGCQITAAAAAAPVPAIPSVILTVTDNIK